jgi:hypothetical protein
VSLDSADVVRDVSKFGDGIAVIQQSNRPCHGGRAEVHVPLRRADLLMPRQFLNRPHRRAAHRKMRTECMSEDVHADISKIRPTRSAPHETLHLPLRQRRAVARAEYPSAPQMTEPSERVRETHRHRGSNRSACNSSQRLRRN